MLLHATAAPAKCAKQGTFGNAMPAEPMTAGNAMRHPTSRRLAEHIYSLAWQDIKVAEASKHRRRASVPLAAAPCPRIFWLLPPAVWWICVQIAGACAIRVQAIDILYPHSGSSSNCYREPGKRQSTWSAGCVEHVVHVVVNLRKKRDGLNLRSVPRNKVHAICKMHQIKCPGILGWKMFARLISRHGPDFVLSFHFWTLIFSMIFLAERRRLLQKIFPMNLKKRPTACATFDCLDRRQEKHIPSIWKPFKKQTLHS